MPVLWSELAETRRSEIFSFIARDNPEAAIMLDNSFDGAADMLMHAPESGRPGRVDGTREFVVHRNYIMIYRVREEYIDILTILHSAMQYPPVQ